MSELKVPLEKVKSGTPVPDEICDFIGDELWREVTSARELAMTRSVFSFIPKMSIIHQFAIKDKTNDQLKMISKKYFQDSNVLHVTTRHLKLDIEKISKFKRSTKVSINQTVSTSAISSTSNMKALPPSTKTIPILQSTQKAAYGVSYDLTQLPLNSKPTPNHDTRNTSLTMSFEVDCNHDPADCVYVNKQKDIIDNGTTSTTTTTTASNMKKLDHSSENRLSNSTQSTARDSTTDSVSTLSSSPEPSPFRYLNTSKAVITTTITPNVTTTAPATTTNDATTNATINAISDKSSTSTMTPRSPSPQTGNESSSSSSSSSSLSTPRSDYNESSSSSSSSSLSTPRSGSPNTVDSQIKAKDSIITTVTTTTIDDIYKERSCDTMNEYSRPRRSSVDTSDCSRPVHHSPRTTTTTTTTSTTLPLPEATKPNVRRSSLHAIGSAIVRRTSLHTLGSMHSPYSMDHTTETHHTSHTTSNSPDTTASKGRRSSINVFSSTSSNNSNNSNSINSNSSTIREQQRTSIRHSLSPREHITEHHVEPHSRRKSFVEMVIEQPQMLLFVG